jgi:hypothetical protein
MENFTDRQLVLLYTGLKVPVAVADLLATPERNLAEDEIYTLQTMISEMNAEKALVTLACCAQILAGHNALDAAARTPLRFQSDCILNDYAGHILTQEKEIEGQVVYMQEDFEALSELFSLSADVARSELAGLSTLCDVLADMSASYAEALEPDLAEFYLHLCLEEIPQAEKRSTANQGNVIPFPHSRFAH